MDPRSVRRKQLSEMLDGSVAEVLDSLAGVSFTNYGGAFRN